MPDTDPNFTPPNPQYDWNKYANTQPAAGREPTWSEFLGADATEAYQTSPLASGIRFLDSAIQNNTARQLQEGTIDPANKAMADKDDNFPPVNPTLSPEEANSKYWVPGMNKFSMPVSRSTAQIVQNHQIAINKSNDVISRAQLSPLSNLGNNLAISAMQMLDPTQDAMYFVPVWGEESAYAKVADTLGKSLVGRSASAAVRITGEMTRGSIESNIADYALNAPLQQQKSVEEYANEDLDNIVSGTFLGLTAKGLLKTFGKGVDFYNKLSPEVQDHLQNNLTSDTPADVNKVLDIEPKIVELEQQTGGVPLPLNERLALLTHEQATPRTDHVPLTPSPEAGINEGSQTTPAPTPNEQPPLLGNTIESGTATAPVLPKPTLVQSLSNLILGNPYEINGARAKSNASNFMEASIATMDYGERGVLGNDLRRVYNELANMSPEELVNTIKLQRIPYPIKGPEVAELAKGPSTLVTSISDQLKGPGETGARNNYYKNVLKVDHVDADDLGTYLDSKGEERTNFIDPTGEVNRIYDSNDLEPEEKEQIAQPQDLATNKYDEALLASAHFSPTLLLKDVGIDGKFQAADMDKLDQMYGTNNWMLKLAHPRDSDAGVGIYYANTIKKLFKDGEAPYNRGHLREHGAEQKITLAEFQDRTHPQDYFVQQLAKVKGATPELREKGFSVLDGEKRPHVVTDLKGGVHPLIGATIQRSVETGQRDARTFFYDTPESLGAENKAKATIESMPESERRGAHYGPDMMRLEGDKPEYHPAELNPTTIGGTMDKRYGWEMPSGASGAVGRVHLLDAYVNALRGELPTHVRYTREIMRQLAALPESTDLKTISKSFDQPRTVERLEQEGRKPMAQAVANGRDETLQARAQQIKNDVVSGNNPAKVDPHTPEVEPLLKDSTVADQQELTDKLLNQIQSDHADLLKSLEEDPEGNKELIDQLKDGMEDADEEIKRVSGQKSALQLAIQCGLNNGL